MVIAFSCLQPVIALIMNAIAPKEMAYIGQAMLVLMIMPGLFISIRVLISCTNTLDIGGILFVQYVPND